MKRAIILSALLTTLPLSALAAPCPPLPQASRNAMIMPGNTPYEGMDPSAANENPARQDLPLYHRQG